MYFDEEAFYYDCLGFICEDYVRFDKLSRLIDGDEEGIITIKGYAGSYAETYAKEKGIPFEEIKEE